MSSTLTAWLIRTVIFFVVLGTALFFAYRENKQAEERRVNEILAHKSDWGETMCQWLIENEYRLSDERTKRIMDNYQAWGQNTCQRLLQQPGGTNLDG